MDKGVICILTNELLRVDKTVQEEAMESTSRVSNVRGGRQEAGPGKETEGVVRRVE